MNRLQEISEQISMRLPIIGVHGQNIRFGKEEYTATQLQNVCGLGTVTGLHGANCYHDYNPFIPGISARTYTDEQLAQMMEEENTPKKYLGKEYTTYQALQQQRQMERNMRKTRQDIKLLQEGGANDRSVVSKKARYQLQMQQYKAFSNAIGLPEQMPRVYQDGLGQVSSGKISEKVKQGAKHRLASSQSYKRSLEYVRNGKAGLSKARKALLERVPTENSWTSLKKERILHFFQLIQNMNLRYGNQSMI